MDTFGETLKSEREDRGLTIEVVSEMLAVDQDMLRALERNDFEALPDDATMLSMLQGYARCLEVDAEMMIDDYVKERERCLQQLADQVGEPAVAEPPVEVEDAPAAAEVAPAVAEALADVLPDPSPPIRQEQPPLASLVAVCVVLAAGAVFTAWYMFSGEGAASSPQSPAADVPTVAQTAEPSISDASGASAPTATRRTAPVGPDEAVPTTTKQPARRRAATTPTPTSLGITEFGVGTGVKNRQLVGQRRDFAEGSDVWFWTNVEGGGVGDKIEHVWLRDGEVALRVPLQLGGARWRTYSNKTMHAGSAGEWAVEARDSSGRVLARTEFSCTP